MVEAHAVAVVGLRRALGRLAQTDRSGRAREVEDRLATLTFNFAHAVPAERTEEIAIERQAAFDRGNDQVHVVDARRMHGCRSFAVALAIPTYNRAGCSSSTITS